MRTVQDGGTVLLALSPAESATFDHRFKLTESPSAVWSRTAITKAARSIPQETKAACYQSLVRLAIQRFPRDPALVLQDLHAFLFDTLKFDKINGGELLVVDGELFGKTVRLEQYGVNVRRRKRSFASSEA